MAVSATGVREADSERFCAVTMTSWMVVDVTSSALWAMLARLDRTSATDSFS